MRYFNSLFLAHPSSRALPHYYSYNRTTHLEIENSKTIFK